MGKIVQLKMSKSRVDELNDFVSERPYHDLSWSHKRDNPTYSRTTVHGSGYQGKLRDTAVHRLIATERDIRVKLLNREIVPVAELPTPVSEIQDPAAVCERLGQVFGPNSDLTHGCGTCDDRATGFNPHPSEQQSRAEHGFEYYRAPGHKHHRTAYESMSHSSAYREAEGLLKVFSAAVKPHRKIDDCDFEVPREAPYHKADTRAPIVRDHYHPWVCPGRLEADCFNYYEHESAEHPQNPHDPDLIHGHSGSGHPEAPGCDDVWRRTTRANRAVLVQPGSKLISTGMSPF